VVKPKAIKIVPRLQNVTAQMPIAVAKSLGRVQTRYPLMQLTVERGIIHWPKCRLPDARHEIAFAGTLTFDKGELVVDGEFLDYSFPDGGNSSPGLDLAGAGKRGG
jgi:hypothetical protein